MDYETRKEIAKIKARLKELETKLAISSMPEEVSALLDDLGMLPDADVDNRVSLEMIEEFIVDMGYHTRSYPELSTIAFTDMFKDYEVILRNDDSIELSLGEELDPEVDLNILHLASSTQDMGVSVKLDNEKGTILFRLISCKLKPDTFRGSIRFFINLLNESSKKLFYDYTVLYESKRKSVRLSRLDN